MSCLSLYCFSYRRRKQLGKIKYVKSSDLSKTERKKQREQWRASSRNYRERKKMTGALLEFMPPSMVSTPPKPDNFNVNSTGQERSAYTAQDLVDPLPLKEEFSPLHWYPPDQRRNGENLLRSTAEKNNAKRDASTGKTVYLK